MRISRRGGGASVVGKRGREGVALALFIEKSGGGGKHGWVHRGRGWRSSDLAVKN